MSFVALRRLDFVSAALPLALALLLVVRVVEFVSERVPEARRAVELR